MDLSTLKIPTIITLKDGAVVGRIKGYYQKMIEGQPYKEEALVRMEADLSAGLVTWSVNGG